MPVVQRPSPADLPNRLLAALPYRDSRRLIALCERVELVFGAVLYEPGERIREAYFPLRGFVSLMIPVDGVTNLEVGLVGNEGMLGAPLVMGVDVSPLRALVQGQGFAWRIGAREFVAELARGAAVRRSLQRYVQVRICHLAQTAACTRFHLVEERLARWLLMTQDRAHDNEFRVTHAFLAFMLGVRRVGVTKAATALQKRNLISYHRGEVKVLDRAGMEKAACGCYQTDRDTYENLLAAAA